jgi:trimethylamine--corrinoid protein Co-methyltransferase
MLKNHLYSLFVDQKDIELIHEYTLKTLKEIGVVFEHPEALEVFKKHGARIDGEKVYLDEKMIREILSKVPAEFELHGREGTMGFGESYETRIGSGALNPFIIDEDDNIRSATIEDNLKFYKLIQTSNVADIITMPVMDVPEFTRKSKDSYFAQMLHMLKYSNKFLANPARPNSGNIGNRSIRQGVAEYHKILKDFYGVEDKYIVIEMVCAVSPLANDFDIIENILAAAEANQPINICASSMTNMTSPTTLMGTIIHDNALLLATIALIQLLNPGLPVIAANVSAPTDMRYLQMASGAPESAILGSVAIAMGKYYGIPTRNNTTLTDSVHLDYQAGAESMISAMQCLSNTAFVMNGLGVMGNYNVCSFEKFVMDEEILGYIKRFTKGIDTSLAEVGFEQLKKVGPKGSFIMGRTPREYRKETYLTSIYHKAGGSINAREENEELRQKAVKEIERRIEEYELPELDKAQQRLIDKYLTPFGL